MGRTLLWPMRRDPWDPWVPWQPLVHCSGSKMLISPELDFRFSSPGGEICSRRAMLDSGYSLGDTCGPPTSHPMLPIAAVGADGPQPEMAAKAHLGGIVRRAGGCL